MSFLNTLKTAIESLSHSKLRSLLTILGIIIGVAAVILVLALGTGATQSVLERFRFLGSNQVVIYPVSSVINPDAKPITFDEALGMEELHLVERVHIALGGPATAARGWTKLDTSISGTVAPTPEELAQEEEDSDWTLAQGEPFTREDVDYESRVCVIGHTVAEQLFLDEDPVGQTIRIKGIPFLVIGVFEEKLQEKGQFSDPNNFIKIPISTAAAELYGRDASVVVTADIVSEKSISDAMDEIVAYLRQCHKIAPAAGGEDDFAIHSFQTEAKAAMESAKTFSALLSGLAAVSLIVGGIGIMNIMLVS
ncbi:MAG: ABC transporter permease, partial [Dehalococcoidia bacterium]|nr:ABC transporter permease [Dehalococcoidia bacterium]